MQINVKKYKNMLATYMLFHCCKQPNCRKNPKPQFGCTAPRESRNENSQITAKQFCSTATVW